MFAESSEIKTRLGDKLQCLWRREGCGSSYIESVFQYRALHGAKVDCAGWGFTGVFAAGQIIPSTVPDGEDCIARSKGQSPIPCHSPKNELGGSDFYLRFQRARAGCTFGLRDRISLREDRWLARQANNMKDCSSFWMRWSRR